MTSWPEQPPTGQPQTRRQAREFERSASRRAGTAEPTPAGQIPDVTTNVPPRDPAEVEQAEAQQGAVEPAVVEPETAAAQETEKAAERPVVPERPAIPASAFAEPGVTSPSRDSFDLFRQAPDASQPEPVTQPMAILQQPSPASTSSGDDSRERTLTRRELRAMLQAQEANAQANHPV